MLALAKSCGFHDLGVVDLFRDGAPLLGQLDRRFYHLPAHLHALAISHCRAGLGKEIPYEADSPKELHKLREARNAELLRSLKDSDMSAELMESCRKDQNAGRMAIMRQTSWTSPVLCN